MTFSEPEPAGGLSPALPSPVFCLSQELGKAYWRSLWESLWGGACEGSLWEEPVGGACEGKPVGGACGGSLWRGVCGGACERSYPGSDPGLPIKTHRRLLKVGSALS